MLVGADEGRHRVRALELVRCPVVERRRRHDRMTEVVGAHVSQVVAAELLGALRVVRVRQEGVIVGDAQAPLADAHLAHRLAARVALRGHTAPAQFAGVVVERQHLVTRGHLLDRLDAAGRCDRRPLSEAPDVAVDPFHVALGLDPRPLGDEVVDVRTPVLDRRVRHPRARLDDDLDDGRVQRVARVHRRRAALDVVHLRALVGDDQRALELPGVLGVDAEVRLQRHLDVHARRHVDEAPARPDTGVQRGELVVARRDHGAEVLRCTRSGYSRSAVSMSEKRIPCFASSSRLRWYTTSLSYWAVTPARYWRSASGMPSFS